MALVPERRRTGGVQFCLLSWLRCAALAASVLIPGRRLHAQSADTAARTTPGHDSASARLAPTQSVLWLVDESPVTRIRLAEISGEPIVTPMLLRSPSVFLERGNQGRRAVTFLGVQSQLVTNSALPYSRNDGALWAGRGRNTRTSVGVALQGWGFRVVAAPELLVMANDDFPLRTTNYIKAPAIPSDRSRFAFPWYVTGPYSIDLPIRFGDKAIRHIVAGQSSATFSFRNLEAGVATENEWWGPGIDNAIVLSNNASGFPHALIRTKNPIVTRLGDVDFRWLVGGLRESGFFDTDANDNLRSISAAAATLRLKRAPNLTVGAARSVYAAATGWRQVSERWLDVLRGVGHPNDRPLSDSSLYPGGRDQLYSLFARWVLPDAGAEIYGEWGRTEFPRSVRDLLVAPNHSQAYTLGLQWTRDGFRPGQRVHIRFENTSTEQSPTFRDRPLGVWYTSRTVIQGYSNDGQALGAAVGPGSSGQTVEANYFIGRSFIGLEFGRTRYNEDVHSLAPMESYLRWCSHDVALQWGPHLGISSRYGYVSLRSLYQERVNVFFQGGQGCPRSVGNTDIRNRNLTITFSPFQAGR